MPTVNYLRNNDYKPQEYKPYELPYNAMLQAAQTRNQYFLQSVSAMQSAWQRIDGLDPQNVTNKANLKTLREQYEKDFQKIANSDLTIQGNQNRFKEIADSMYDTSDPTKASILKDHSRNDFFKKQSQLSERARTSNGGKNWNEDNDFFWKSAYLDYQNWAKNGDPKDIDNIEERGFIPYYDYSKDLKQARELCNGGSSKTSIPVQGTGYIYSHSTEGKTPQEVAQCLALSLPGAAKQQIDIEGFKAYYYDRETLTNDFERYAFGANKKLLEDTKAEIVANSLKKDLTDEDKLKLEEAREKLKEIQENYDESKKEFELLHGNTLEYINKNYKGLSGRVHSAKVMSQLGQALSDYNTTTEFKGDPVQMQTKRFAQETNERIQSQNYRTWFETYINQPFLERQQKARLENDFLMAQMRGDVSSNARLRLNPQTGRLELVDSPNPQLELPNSDNSEKANENYDYYLSLKNDSEKLVKENYDVLVESIKKSFPEYNLSDLSPDGLKKIITKITKDATLNGGNLTSKGKDLQNLYLKYEESVISNNNINNLWNNAVNEVGADKDYLKQFEGLKSKKVTLSDGTKLTGEQLYQLIQGKSVNGITLDISQLPPIKSEDLTKGTMFDIPESHINSIANNFADWINRADSPVNTISVRLIKNGVDISNNESGKLFRWYAESFNKRKEKIAKVITKNYGNIDTWYDLPDYDSKLMKNIETKLTGWLGVEGGFGKGFDLLGRKADGRVKIRVRNGVKNYSENKIIGPKFYKDEKNGTFSIVMPELAFNRGINNPNIEGDLTYLRAMKNLFSTIQSTKYKDSIILSSDVLQQDGNFNNMIKKGNSGKDYIIGIEKRGTDIKFKITDRTDNTKYHLVNSEEEVVALLDNL